MPVGVEAPRRFTAYRPYLGNYAPKLPQIRRIWRSKTQTAV